MRFRRRVKGSDLLAHLDTSGTRRASPAHEGKVGDEVGAGAVLKPARPRASIHVDDIYETYPPETSAGG